MSEKFSAMRNSDDRLGSSDSLGENQDSLALKDYNYKTSEQKSQQKFRDKVDNQEHKKADADLENDISTLEISNENELNDFLEKHYPNNSKAEEISRDFFKKSIALGISLSKKELRQKISENIDYKEEVLIEDKIKHYKENLTKQGKSQTEILSLLISKFDNEEAVSTWVENWRNFQKLHQFAENKPPAEKRAIHSIISKADFTSESAFSTSLTQISQSAEISNETKLEISRNFGGSHIDSVDGMDYQLKEVKSHTKAIEKEIGVKSREKSSLDLEIENLETELKTLPLDDPKRQELENRIEQKKEVLEQTETEINRLEKGKPKDLSFTLRQGFSAKLNPGGGRSIKINSIDFAIKIPSNRLPFTSNKNLRAINLAFPYAVLKELQIADLIFRPNISNNSVPDKSQRDMGHLILSSLGIDDRKILSEESIKQIKKDLLFLTPKNGKTTQEHLIDLGVFDVESQSISKTKLKGSLEEIQKSR